METKINETKEIMLKLARIESDMKYIKEHIKDISLTEEEEDLLKKSYKNEKSGKLISSKQLRADLGI